MATWNSRGLRGSTLEELINRTNEKYAESNLALIQKIPTPITPIKIDKEHRHITLAYFDQKSTVDYIGAVQGIPVCFDAKECAVDTFSLQNIHAHQVKFMEQFEQHAASCSTPSATDSRQRSWAPPAAQACSVRSQRPLSVAQNIIILKTMRD